jgi:hypothetical protein
VERAYPRRCQLGSSVTYSEEVDTKRIRLVLRRAIPWMLPLTALMLLPGCAAAATRASSGSSTPSPYIHKSAQSLPPRNVMLPSDLAKALPLPSWLATNFVAECRLEPGTNTAVPVFPPGACSPLEAREKAIIADFGVASAVPRASLPQKLTTFLAKQGWTLSSKFVSLTQDGLSERQYDLTGHGWTGHLYIRHSCCQSGSGSDLVLNLRRR